MKIILTIIWFFYSKASTDKRNHDNYKPNNSWTSIQILEANSRVCYFLIVLLKNNDIENFSLTKCMQKIETSSGRLHVLINEKKLNSFKHFYVEVIGNIVTKIWT